MRVKLVKDVLQNGQVKTVKRPGRPGMFFEAGQVVEVSDATGAKWVAAGMATDYVAEDAKAPPADAQ